ncbi:MAG: response regulator [Desulfomonilaceae bacterium]
MEKLKVLIVDDEEEFVDPMIKRLNDRGLEAVGAYRGQQALDLLLSKDFDVVILDQRMPGMDGFETLRELRKSKPFLPVIMLTGQGPSELGVQGLELCDHNHLVKPVPFDDLLKEIHRVHKKRPLQRTFCPSGLTDNST